MKHSKTGMGVYDNTGKTIFPVKTPTFIGVLSKNQVMKQNILI